VRIRRHPCRDGREEVDVQDREHEVAWVTVGLSDFTPINNTSGMRELLRIYTARRAAAAEM